MNVAGAFVASASLHHVALFMHVMENPIWRVTAGVNRVALFTARVFQASADARGRCAAGVVASVVFGLHCCLLFVRKWIALTIGGWIASCRLTVRTLASGLAIQSPASTAAALADVESFCISKQRGLEIARGRT